MKTLRTILFTLPFVLPLTACSIDDTPPDVSAEVDMSMADPADLSMDTDLSTAPTDMVTPPVDMAALPTDMAAPPTDMAAPSTDMATSPVDMAMLRR